MRATIRVPHVRDSLIVANVGGVTNVVEVTNTGGFTKKNKPAIPPKEAR